MRENDIVELKMLVNGKCQASLKAQASEFVRLPLMDQFLTDVFQLMNNRESKVGDEVLDEIVAVMRKVEGLNEEEFYEVMNAAHQRLHQEEALADVSVDQESGPMADSVGRRTGSVREVGGSQFSDRWPSAAATKRPRG